MALPSLRRRLCSPRGVSLLLGDTTTAVLSSIVSAQEEEYGWTALLQPRLLDFGAGVQVARISTTALSIQIPQVVGYDISEAETITVTLPPEALRSRQGFVVHTPFLIYPAPPTATLSGRTLSFPEFDVQSQSSFTFSVGLSGAPL